MRLSIRKTPIGQAPSDAGAERQHQRAEQRPLHEGEVGEGRDEQAVEEFHHAALGPEP